MSLDYEPMSLRFRDDPYPVYRQLRDTAPVHRAPESGTLCVSRYEDVMSVLKRPEIFSSRAMFEVLMNGGREGPPPLSWQSISFLVRYLWKTGFHPRNFATARNLIASDPPVHGALRGIVNRGFTPRRIEVWEPRVHALVRECVAKLDRGESFDVVRDLAIPLPVTIIAEMIGVETEHIDDFKHWSDRVIEGMSGSKRGQLFHPETTEALIGLNQYMARMVKQRRRAPGDDLVSAILAEAPEGEALSNLEVVIFVQLLLVAGNETTTNLIGNAVMALLDNPEQLERVSKDPSLVPALVEEALRYDAPVQMVFRKATRAVEIAGVGIPEDSTVVALLGSANRDERRFEDAERFDVGRDARGHLGFGFGQHFCLGASLARMEAAAALGALVPRLAGLERSNGSRELLDSFLVRGPRSLELCPAA